MKVLYVDDIRFPEYFHKIGAEITIVRTYDEAIKYIDNNYDIISLDHDLGENKTGYDIAKWIISSGYSNIQFKIHSMNPVGVKNIREILNHYRYDEI